MFDTQKNFNDLIKNQTSTIAKISDIVSGTEEQVGTALDFSQKIASYVKELVKNNEELVKEINLLQSNLKQLNYEHGQLKNLVSVKIADLTVMSQYFDMPEALIDLILKIDEGKLKGVLISIDKDKFNALRELIDGVKDER